MEKSEIINLLKKGCSIQRIAVWGSNADNPHSTRKLGDIKNLEYIEKTILEWQQNEGMIKFGGH